jgi:C1A family cysteine protease
MQLHYPLNYIPDGIYKKDYEFDISLFKELEKNQLSKFFKLLPKKIDHTNNMTPVKDQGSLGSCVAFAVVALKEWQEWQEFLKIKHKLKKQINLFNDLSEQWVYHKAKEIDNIQNEGTTIRAALQVLKNYGVPPEQSWKYNPDIKGEPLPESIILSKCTYIGNYYRLQKLNHLKLALLHTPVPIGIITTESFFTTQNGIIVDDIQHTGKHGGHAVCAVGYDDNEKLIKFKNSWSSSWGDNGYGYLTYDYYNKYCIVAWAIEDIQVPIDFLNDLII